MVNQFCTRFSDLMGTEYGSLHLRVCLSRGQRLFACEDVTVRAIPHDRRDWRARMEHT